jgi:hypothetical protein
VIPECQVVSNCRQNGHVEVEKFVFLHFLQFEANVNPSSPHRSNIETSALTFTFVHVGPSCSEPPYNIYLFHHPTILPPLWLAPFRLHKMADTNFYASDKIAQLGIATRERRSSGNDVFELEKVIDFTSSKDAQAQKQDDVEPTESAGVRQMEASSMVWTKEWLYTAYVL